jgi:hypothetical protein
MSERSSDLRLDAEHDAVTTRCDQLFTANGDFDRHAAVKCML